MKTKKQCTVSDRDLHIYVLGESGLKRIDIAKRFGLSPQRCYYIWQEVRDALKRTDQFRFLAAETENALRRVNINTFEQAFQFSDEELLKIHGIGPTALEDIKSGYELFKQATSNSP